MISLLSSSASLTITCSSHKTSPSTPKHISTKAHNHQLCVGKFCFCGRRSLLEAAATTLLSVCPSKASTSPSAAMAALDKIHPSRPDWYEEFCAWNMYSIMKAYEAEVAGWKTQMFSNLKGKAKNVVEIGIGTGPNLKYYVGDTDVRVFGIDPNRKMEKYAQEAAVAAGLPLSNFNFIHAVGESIPLSDASVDAAVGTLVLCSVKDVDKTLKEVKRVLKPGGLYLFVEHVAAKDGTILKFWQRVLDPLQQTVVDGCHLTRETGNNISRAGFSDVELSMAFVSDASLISPHVYGIACK
ncbi:Methyltransf_11 domain-containing protein [Cephalotus follicularis]|uniref:Methyltransf_11 domain-containing protein n=1 Tax=Cephalotus follicularis TaxID=3775 RepID=A0A1Q3D001_CEPFO|nr:Methyltransf_11 domain-containing protein [Cephalotus follicularis]